MELFNSSKNKILKQLLIYRKQGNIQAEVMEQTKKKDLAMIHKFFFKIKYFIITLVGKIWMFLNINKCLILFKLFNSLQVKKEKFQFIDMQDMEEQDQLLDDIQFIDKI